MKKELAKRFKHAFPQYRLLAITLDGFYHTIFCDSGDKGSEVIKLRHSVYENMGHDIVTKSHIEYVFQGYSNYEYQNNAQQIVWINPGDR